MEEEIKEYFNQPESNDDKICLNALQTVLKLTEEKVDGV